MCFPFVAGLVGNFGHFGNEKLETSCGRESERESVSEKECGIGNRFHLPQTAQNITCRQETGRNETSPGFGISLRPQ
jgi:hypothetical protein